MAICLIYAIYNLIGMASLFNVENKLAGSATLLAATKENSTLIGLKIEPELQEPYEQVLPEVTKTLSPHELQSAWEAGKNMDLEQPSNLR